MKPSFWMIVLLVFAALLLFGGFKKLPDAARSVGRSLRIFKAETQGLIGDDEAKEVEGAAKPAVESGQEKTVAETAADAETGESKPSGSA